MSRTICHRLLPMLFFIVAGSFLFLPKTSQAQTPGYCYDLDIGGGLSCPFASGDLLTGGLNIGIPFGLGSEGQLRIGPVAILYNTPTNFYAGGMIAYKLGELGLQGKYFNLLNWYARVDALFNKAGYCTPVVSAELEISKLLTIGLGAKYYTPSKHVQAVISLGLELFGKDIEKPISPDKYPLDTTTISGLAKNYALPMIEGYMGTNAQKIGQMRSVLADPSIGSTKTLDAMSALLQKYSVVSLAKNLRIMLNPALLDYQQSGRVLPDQATQEEQLVTGFITALQIKVKEKQ